MKALSIGRDQGCDIVINDITDVISRRHAILNVSTYGKMTIVDQSRNGTYVNGIRISPNVPVPVTRKDIVSFAHVAKLDWKVVHAPNSVMRYAIMGLVGVVVALSAIFAYQYFIGSRPDGKKTETQLVDSLKQRKDSIDVKTKVPEEKKDSTKVDKKTERKAGKDEKAKSKQEKVPAASVVPKDTTKNNRPIG